MTKTYKSPKTSLAEDEVFVFTSNNSGYHGAGSAGFASFGKAGNVWREFDYDKKPNGWKGKWNVKGVSVGPQVGTEGKSYAIPTVTRAGAKRSIPLETIKGSIQTFYTFAKSRPNLKFFVAQGVEGNLNGYSAEEMASIYSGEIPENVYFDEGFVTLLNKSGNETDFVTKTPNKCIIAGSRTINDYSLICAAINESGFDIDEVVCGEAFGPDKLGKLWAEENGIPVKSFPADWNNLSHPDAVIKTNSRGQKYDALAGHRRNAQMRDCATHLVLIWDGKSSGSANMLKLAKEKGLVIYEKIT
jgi:hypothetical protein